MQSTPLQMTTAAETGFSEIHVPAGYNGLDTVPLLHTQTKFSSSPFMENASEWPPFKISHVLEIGKYPFISFHQAGIIMYI